MKQLTLLVLIFFFTNGFSQTSNDIEILIEPNVQTRIYVNERTEFNCYLINKSDTKYYIPLRNLTEYPTAFVDDDFDLFGPDGEEIPIRNAPGGNASGVSHPAQIIKENGGRAKTRSFFTTFSEPGTYRLVLNYYVNSDHKPAHMTTEYKSFNSVGELTFEVFERDAISFEKKEIDYDTYLTQPLISDMSKTNDSTNVFNLSVLNATEAELVNISKFKNLRGLGIQSTNLSELPEELFELDLFDLSINVTATTSSDQIDFTGISKFKNLRKLSIFYNGSAFLPSDFSIHQELKELTLMGFKNEVAITALPKENLAKLEFKNLQGLTGIDGNFSEFKRLGRLAFISIQNFQLPTKITGHIWELELSAGPFTEFPDLSDLTISRIRFYTFTGESLPENFQSYLKPGAQVMFPNSMAKSKDYKKLKKAGFSVFPK